MTIPITNGQRRVWFDGEVSEFSSSYHLAAADRQEAVALLERSGLEGWIVGDGGGWVTFVLGGAFESAANARLVADNTGTLLFYVNAEDHGTGFEVFEGTRSVGNGWWDWNDGEPAVQTDGVDAVRAALGAVVGVDVAGDALTEFLAPRSSDVLFADYPTNPGHLLARRLGLPAFEWLSGHYVETFDRPLPPDWLVVGARRPDDLVWVPVTSLRAPGRVGELRPRDIEVPTGSDAFESSGESDGLRHWMYRVDLRGHSTAAVVQELLDRARNAGYHIDEIDIAAGGPSSDLDRHFSLWHRGDTTVQAMVDTRGRVTTLMLTSPVVAEEYRSYPQGFPAR